MYPSHPAAATYVARLYLEEDVARSARYRAASEARRNRKAARRAVRAAAAPRRRPLPVFRRTWSVRLGH
jgi:hypothetical protein